MWPALAGPSSILATSWLCASKSKITNQELCHFDKFFRHSVFLLGHHMFLFGREVGTILTKVYQNTNENYFVKNMFNYKCNYNFYKGTKIQITLGIFDHLETDLVYTI